MRPETEPGPRVHDWNGEDRAGHGADRRVRIQDETLREGLQSGVAVDPPDDVKVELLLGMERLGVEHASVGMPIAGERASASAVRLCRVAVDAGLALRPNAGGRTAPDDVRAIAEVAQAVGSPVDAFLFLGCSPIRRAVEGWDRGTLVARTIESVGRAVREGLETTFVVEDATRSTPDDLATLIGAAVDVGARHVCLCDTVGVSTPRGTRAIVRWTRRFLAGRNPGVGLDWHGHDDRGLALANAAAAASAGADRIHVTALGLGERAGNVALEQFLVHLRLAGLDARDLTALGDHVEAVAAALGVGIPHDAPVVGSDVHRTATGVHAAAIEKARARGDDDLAERVYGAVPASWVGRRQEIRVGPMSGAANVRAVLRAAGATADETTVARVLARAKRVGRVLEPDEIDDAVRLDGARAEVTR